MRQPATRVKLAFVLPAQWSSEKLDLWIQEALESDIDCYEPIYLGNQSTGRAEELYLVRLLYVTTILLQDIRIPVFERAAIVSIETNQDQPRGCVADIWFPIVEAFPLKVFHTWLFIANELIANVCKQGNDKEVLENIYQELQKKYVLPWSRQNPGGKSTVPILQAAFELGIPFAHCGSGRYLLGWGSQSRLFDRSSNALDSAIGAVASHNKDVALEIMRFAGVPVPKGVTLKSGEQVNLAMLAHLRMPLVVKPVDKDRGEGVTMGVASEDALQIAVAGAAKNSRSILVEEQIEGTCHRILVVDGKIIYVVKRNPRAVTGDGVKNIAELVEDINDAIRKKIPQKRLQEIDLDQQMDEYLAESGRNRKSIPELGQIVYLRINQSTQWGGDPEDVTPKLHPDNADIAIRAARLFGLNCAGVDFISTDVAVPWHQNGAVINEVNYSPLMGRTREYQRKSVKTYLNLVFPEKGRIPIDVYIGPSTKLAAKNLWHQKKLAGKECFLCTDDGLFKADDQPFYLAGAQDVLEKISMLRAITTVDAIVIHSNSSETFSMTGWPSEDFVSHSCD